ncbi:TolC family protein [Nitrosomonas sp. ANs5]|uniref:TolC family protein n=1 Tax=Nitrosomonas sp. ANs5 TaxID=3423941 RepID=UPI003D34C2C6
MKPLFSSHGGLVFLLLLATLLILTATHTRADNQLAVDSNNRAEQRLSSEESLLLRDFATEIDETLEHHIITKPLIPLPAHKSTLRIDVHKALSGVTSQMDEREKRSDEHNLSIPEIRKIALENNLSLKIANIEPVIAETTVGEERAKFDNIIFANANLRHLDAPGIGGDNVKLSSSNPLLNDQRVKLSLEPQKIEQLNAEAGIAIPLRTGGVVTLSSPIERKITKGQLDSDEFRSALRFSISQPLLRNAGIAVNEASINIAHYERRAVDMKTRLQSIRVISIIDKAYWELFAAWAELDVRRQQYDLANQNLAMVQRRVDEGLTAAIEISRAEIGVTDRVESLIIANTKLKLSQRQLKFLLNDQTYTIDSDIHIVPTTTPTLVYYNLDRKQIASLALDGRLELLELELRLAADLTRIEFLENQTLPLFTLDYSYGALSNSRGSFSQTYEDVVHNRFNDWSIGLRFELPMTNEARRMQLQRAVQQRIQRLTTKTLQEQVVLREIYDVFDQVEQNWQRILATRQQVILAGINYEAELKQFKEGLRTMTEVLEMLTFLGEAQIREIHAVRDYQAALIDLAYATGTLLGYSRVEF